MVVRNFNIEDLPKVVELWNKSTKIYKPFTNDTFVNHVLN